MQSDYNIHPSTLRKLCRLGTLKSRELKRLDGTVYERLFVVNENKDFFKEHPKKPKMEIKLEWSNEKKALLLSSKEIQYKEAGKNEKIPV